MVNRKSKIQSIAVLGAGSFGTALAHSFAKAGKDINLWGRDKEAIGEINRSGVNRSHMPGIQLNEKVRGILDLEQAIEKVDMIVLSIPSHSVCSIVDQILPQLTSKSIVVNTAKGFIPGGIETISEYLEAKKPENDLRYKVATLAGPNLARFLAQGKTSGAVFACKNYSTSRVVSNELSTQAFRIFHSRHVRAVEIVAVLKNIYAIAMGFSSEILPNINTTALLFSRCIAEMRILLKALGEDSKVLMGVAGVGDFFATSTNHSRNFSFGKNIAMGYVDPKRGDQAEYLVEGRSSVHHCYPVLEKIGIDLPIMHCIYSYLYEGLTIPGAMEILSELPTFQAD